MPDFCAQSQRGCLGSVRPPGENRIVCISCAHTEYETEQLRAEDAPLHVRHAAGGIAWPPPLASRAIGRECIARWREGGRNIDVGASSLCPSKANALPPAGTQLFKLGTVRKLLASAD